MTAIGSHGESSVSGGDVRRGLGLRSTWFRIGVLSLSTPDAPVTFGKRVSLNGIARSVPGVKLERREAGAAWQPVGPVSPAPDGSVTVTAKMTRADRFQARERHGPEPGSRTSRSLRSYASVGWTPRLFAATHARCSRGERRRATARGEQVDDGRSRRRSTRTATSRPRSTLAPGDVPGAACARPGLRPRREPHPAGWDLHETPRARSLSSRAGRARARERGPLRRRPGQGRIAAELVAQRIEARTGRPVSTIAPFALTVDTPNSPALRSIRGVAWVERLRHSRRLSFTPNDPLAVRQWYLNRISAFDAWPQLPSLLSVRVAVIDSGIDADHPELERQIVGRRQLRRQLLAERHERARHVRRRRDRRFAEQRAGDRGHRLPG